MQHPTDEQLVTAYLKGDRESLNILIKRYLTPIFNYALGLVKNEDAADDLTQEIFVKVWQKIKKFDNRYKFKNWLYALARNTCLDYFKKHKIMTFSEINPAGDILFFENLIKEILPSPQAGLETAEEAVMINSALDRLPEKYKTAVKLHYQGGYKFREIAGMLKTSIETVKSRNRRALIKLKKIIKGQ